MSHGNPKTPHLDAALAAQENGSLTDWLIRFAKLQNKHIELLLAENERLKALVAKLAPVD